MQFEITPEKLQQTLEIAGLVASGVTAVVVGFWRLSKWVVDINAHQEKTAEQVSNLSAVFSEHQDKTSEQVLKLSEVVAKLAENISILTVKLDEREKDLMKLEGALDIQRKDMMNVITSLQKVSGSLDAAWRVMQNQNKAPVRMSDKP